MEELGVNYGDRHRAFLQALLARGTITFEESKPLLAEIMNAENDGDLIRPEQITEDEFDEYIQVAGQMASLFDYEIRNTLHQVTKQRIYAFVNTTSDPQTQLATTFAPDALAFVKRVLEAMFDKYNTPRMEIMAITSMQAIKLARPDRRQSQSQPQPQTQTEIDPDNSQVQAATDRGLKHSEVESIMNELVDGEWFEKSREGFYSLSPRALLELRPWLIAMFNDTDAEADEWQRVKFCEACKEIVTVGLRCKNPACTLRLHDHCQDAFWRAKRSKNCTKCEEEWTGDKYVGERAVTMTEAYQRGRRHGGRGTNLAEEVVQQNQGSEAEEEEEEEEEGEEEEQQ